jgi:hypothetical protein
MIELAVARILEVKPQSLMITAARSGAQVWDCCVILVISWTFSLIAGRLPLLRIFSISCCAFKLLSIKNPISCLW